jgi:hypothetical protein
LTVVAGGFPIVLFAGAVVVIVAIALAIWAVRAATRPM